MFNFPNSFRIPLDKWVDQGMAWILANLGGGFDAVGDAMLKVLLAVERFLLWVPWFGILLVIFMAGWWASRRWWMGLVYAVMFSIIGALGLWDLAMSTLAIVITSVLISLLIGIPVGILMARSNVVQSVLKPILDAMQTMPSFVYLLPAFMLFGLGLVPAVFATLIYAMPPVIRLTNVGIRQVTPSVIEASKAFGASSSQLLTKTQIPLALPSIMVGTNQTTMSALAMVVIASMIGARGLGQEVLLAINRLELGRGFKAGLAIVLMAIVIDRITAAFSSRQQRVIAQSKA